MTALISVLPAEVIKERELMASDYDPTEEVRELTANISRDFNHSVDLRSQNWRELNDMSVIARDSVDRRAYNAYVPPREGDEEDWKAQTVRPVTRNKVNQIAAKVVGTPISPHIFAQDDNDEEDIASARVMEDLMEWANDQAGYADTFEKAVLAMEITPAACVHVGFEEIKRTVKKINKDGSWTKKEIIDEELSGFKDTIVPVEEIYLGNMHQSDIQQQPFIAWQRDLDWTSAKFKYGAEPNFKFVKPGRIIVFSDDHTGFYEDQDTTMNDRTVREIRYWNKNEDVELVFLNGVLVSDPEQPMRREDKRYPFIWGGYELISQGLFAYFKSLVFKLAPEQAVVDEFYNITLDASQLSLMPPAAIFGEDMIDAGVIGPGNVMTFEDPNTKMEVFSPNHDLAAGYNAIQSVEQNMAEGSQSSFAAGVPLPGERTKFEIQTLEDNARQQLGLFGRRVLKFVEDWGVLRMGDILQFVTVVDMQKLSGEDAIGFSNFILGDKVVDGKKASKKIEFSLDVPEEPQSDQEALLQSLRLLERGVKNKQSISMVNPKLFRELKFKLRVAGDVLFKPSGEQKLQRNMQLYDRAVQHPSADQEMLYKELLINSYRPGEADKFTKEPQPQPQQQEEGAGAAGGGGGEQGATAGGQPQVPNVSIPQPA